MTRAPAEPEQATPARVLVVDDDPAITAALALTLEQSGYHPVEAQGPSEALEVVSRASAASDPPIDLVLQDMNFSRSTSGAEGLELLGELRRHTRAPVVLMTAWGTIDLAVEGMRAGAFDFLTKPWSRARLLEVIETALGVARARQGGGGTSPSRRELESRADFSGIVGEDPRFLHLLDLVARVAPTDASVLITGESGTGKEGLAEALHRNSRRSEGPFVKVNVGGLSPSLFESEMFGHVRGAFTGAHGRRTGRFELAHGGTIFLDEIGELEAANQVKLLRVLQDRTYEPVGSSQTLEVDVRVVAATNRRLDEMVARGTFREDLLYRLNLISLELPPLRERPGDVPLLARFFLARSAERYGREKLRFTVEALRRLSCRSWPGNIRQLEQAVERAVLLCGGEQIDVAELAILDDRPSTEASVAARHLPAVGAMTLDEMERAMIRKALAHHRGNLTRTARSLGLSRAALYRRLHRHGLGKNAAGQSGEAGGPRDTVRAGPDAGENRKRRSGGRERPIRD
ncbi:MAG: sigma-54 dependent transcriptional regulator [Holophagales bacterium]|nr:sigma-54 dependent transcriptional regulator [Holophagales bacterium]